MSSLMNPVLNGHPSSALSTAPQTKAGVWEHGEKGTRAERSGATRHSAFVQGHAQRFSLTVPCTSQHPKSPCLPSSNPARTASSQPLPPGPAHQLPADATVAAQRTCVPHAEVVVLGCQCVQLFSQQDVIR
jgi:hypothetical protein